MVLSQNFAETASITETARELNNLGFATKTWILNNGKLHKGKRFNKSNVRRILNNHLYIGKVKHKDKLFYGMHKPIIDDQIWQKTRELIIKFKLQLQE